MRKRHTLGATLRGHWSLWVHSPRTVIALAFVAMMTIMFTRAQHLLYEASGYALHLGEMVYAEHHFALEHLQVTTSMHRRAGSQREFVQAVTDGALYDITDMREWREEKGNGVVTLPAPGWQSTLEQRGFAGCARHFISCVQNQTVPETAGEQAIMAQRIVERLWREAMSE